MSTLFVKVFLGKRHIDAAEIEDPCDFFTIGRKETCDLVLADNRVSGEHCRIFFQNNSWNIEDLKSTNGVLIDNVRINAQGLKNKDTISIAPFILKMEIKEDVTSEMTCAIDSGEDVTVIDSGITHVEKENNGRLILKKQWVVVSAVLLLFFLGILIKFSGNNRPNEQINNGVSTAQQRKIDRDIYFADILIQKQNYSQALAKLNHAYNIEPDNEKVQSLITSVRQRIKKQQDAERKKLLAEKALEQKINVLLREVENSLAQGDFSSAKDQLATVDRAVLNRFELTGMKEKLLALESRAATLEKEYTKRARKRKEEIRSLCQGVEAAQVKFKNKEYREAKTILNTSATSKIEHKCVTKANELIQTINQILKKNVQGAYKKGYRCYLKEQYPCALREWSLVLYDLPDHEKVKPLYEEILSIQVSKAQKAYREGLAYEGMHDIGTAKKKWQQTLQLLPLPRHEYFMKAKERLKKYP